MDINQMIKEFAGERENEVRGIFSSIFILQNRLQTIFDKTDEILTLKQFMLLTMIKHSNEKTTLTHLGKLLGSSRQNIKKLATSLEEKEFITISHEVGNKKNTSLYLTEKASSYSDKVFSLHTEKLNSIFNDYSDEEIHLFYQLITKLYIGIEREENCHE
ncbi:MarR family winged helix-turn-helix transcriptional regulator [Brevibacillus laterosporus]|uniref:MarR family winged helix-turn-helix transcriptional regulator n=1 Tax=Brevibacillus laterosporus TaxID=1465 RepID=UPI0019580CF4|nr:MarR family transcriptional regulator [Brevibacillus laterosporus]MBM7109730.1 transcriptional repressor MprA [Brevibacillus laterosporus]